MTPLINLTIRVPGGRLMIGAGWGGRKGDQYHAAPNSLTFFRKEWGDWPKGGKRLMQFVHDRPATCAEIEEAIQVLNEYLRGCYDATKEQATRHAPDANLSLPGSCVAGTDG